MDGRHRLVKQRSQVHLLASSGAARRFGGAHAGVRILLSWEFKHLGVGRRLAAEKGTAPILRGRLENRQAIMRRSGCLSTFHMREATLGALANSVALYGVEPADFQGRTLSAADTAAATAMWGSTRCSRAKEVLWGLLVRGFYVWPLWPV